MQLAIQFLQPLPQGDDREIGEFRLPGASLRFV